MLVEIKSHILSSLEGGGFQNLCDALLYAEGYRNIHQLGMKAGTSKTTTGNPDTYFLSASGKYIFVAYTTEQKNINKKIKEDIEKCLDKKETGVDVKDIEKIICCHTSSTLKAGEDQELRKLCASYGITLELYGIDEIANKIYREYPYIAKDVLNLSIGSNQIFPVEEFIEKYNKSNKMNAPLNTAFLYREKEKEEVFKALEKERVTIILGKSGVGKTRLALESAREYQEKYGCKLFCIKCNNLPITEDLSRYISEAGKYLIFIDDANELTGLRYLLEYVMEEDRYDVRIIATVRDYASKIVISEIRKIIEPKRILISGFKDDEIQEFIKQNLKIRDIHCLTQIARIAKGNPRIAYMAGKLAREKNNLQSIMNMEGLYANYYNCFLESVDILTDYSLALTAGIISIFHTIYLENLDRLQDVFNVIKMTKEEFITNIYSLHDKEYVEIKLEKVVKISDQCLSDYMLYFVFFKKKLVGFSDILKVGFQKFRNSTINSVNVLLTIFYTDEMRDYLTEEVNKVWNEFKTDDKLFYEFVKEFHFFKPEESLIYVNEQIEQAENIKIDVGLLEYEKSKWNVNLKDYILRLLVGYRKEQCLSEAIELLIKYCIKKQDIVKEVYSLLESNYGITIFSCKEDYYTQKIVIEQIKNNLDSSVIRKLFYQIARFYLSLSFNSIESEGNGSCSPYSVIIKLSEGSKQYRSEIWREVALLAQDRENAEDTIHLLCSYPNHYGVSELYCTEEIKFDWDYIILVLDNLRVYLESFRFAYVCSKLYRVSKICCCELTKKYKEVFEIEEWSLYKVLSRTYYINTATREEYEAVFQKNLKEYFEKYSVGQMGDLVKRISDVIKITGLKKTDINEGMDYLCELLTQDKEYLWNFVSAYFKYGDNIYIRPEKIIAALLKNFGRQRVVDNIWNREFPKKRRWQFAYFEVINFEMVTQDDYQKFMNLIRETVPVSPEEQFEINLKILDKFKKYSLDIYVDVTKILLKKLGDDTRSLGMYFSSLFRIDYYTLRELLDIYGEMKETLKYIYFKCLENCCYIDYKGLYFKEFIDCDMDWIKCYVIYIQGESEKQEIYDKDYRLDSCWEKDNYLNIFDMYFEELIHTKSLHWACIGHFRKVISFEFKENVANRKEQWIFHYIKEMHDSKNIIELFKVLKEMGVEIRKKAILCFLRYNSNFEMFKRLSLVSDSRIGISSLTDKITFYEELLPEIKGVNFLEHRKLIKDEIERWKIIRNEYELENILLGLYSE